MNSEKTELDFISLIGENIRKFRKRKGWSQEKLGIEIGLDRMEISKMEKGRNITVTTVLKLSLALDIKPETIIKVKFTKSKNALEGLVDSSKAYRQKRS